MGAFFWYSSIPMHGGHLRVPCAPEGRIGAPMLIGFNWEIHAWVIPLTFATGWVIGARLFKDQLKRRHPDLYAEWLRRARPNRDKDES